MLGEGASDIVSLLKGGLEIAECNFSFNQAVDNRGKATTRVHAGTISLTLSQLPPNPVVEWALQSRNYKDGMIIVLDAENMPAEKIIFENAACIGFDIDYTQKGESYASTRLVIQAETIIVGDGVDFLNEWTF
jgi:hypothetical protein